MRGEGKTGKTHASKAKEEARPCMHNGKLRKAGGLASRSQPWGAAARATEQGAMADQGPGP